MVSNCSHSTAHSTSLLNTSGPSSETTSKDAKADDTKDKNNLAEFARHIHIAASIASTTSSSFSGAFGKEMQNAFSGTGITV